MDTHKLKRLCWLLVALSLIPASVLVTRRIQAEGSSRTVTLVMDEPALAEQARYRGLSSFELGLAYQKLGLNGVVLYEDTFESLAGKGDILLALGSQIRPLVASRSDDLADIPATSTLVSELEAGALDWVLAKNAPQAREVTVEGRRWFVYPGLGETRPAGPNSAEIQRWAEAGFDIAYRPRNFPNLRSVAEDFPQEARYLIHAGLQVAGYPNRLEALVDGSQGYLTAVIEGTEQDGMDEVSAAVPTARLLSFNQDYVNRRLEPEVLIDKYLLAANERGVRILYLRPYTEEQLGDMVENTETLVTGLRNRLEREGFEVGPLPTLDIDYRTNLWLRALSAIGIFAALGLLALMYPGIWGLLVSAGVLLLGLLAGGLDWNALALVAALTFPVIGYGHLSEKLSSLGVATLVSLAGAALLAAVGSDREAMLAIEPFAGVAATLVVPPALYLFHYALRFRLPADWVLTLWKYPLRLGDVAIVGIGVVALAVVFLRRGNFPVIGVSSAEIAVRDWLSELFVRPRFKELLGHPMAVLGLTGGGWPAWIRAFLLTGGVVAQASILNSFSHYHTPLLVSLERSVVALLLGLLIGLVLVPVLHVGVRLTRGWLESAGDSRSALETSD